MTKDRTSNSQRSSRRVNGSKPSFSGFSKVLPDLFPVYQKADESTHILTHQAIPVGFHESNPSDILTSYAKALAKSSEFTSITAKFDSGEYSEAPYKLYHDIKLVSSSLIKPHKIGTATYQDIDFFYKFAVELLLRELSRLGLTLQKDPKYHTSELENQLKEDFKRVSTSYTITNGEVITYISVSEEPEASVPDGSSHLHPSHPNYLHQQARKAPSQPLFTSIIRKSELDTEPTSVPDSSFQVSSVIPLVGAAISRSDNTLGSLSPELAKFPSPLDPQQSAILHDFFHPIWYTIPIPTWLTYKTTVIKPGTKAPGSENGSDDPSHPQLRVLQHLQAGDSRTVEASGDSYRSFAPSVDSNDYIITSELKSNIWLHHIGLSEIAKIKTNFVKKANPQAIEEKKEDNVPEDDDIDEDDDEEEESNEPREITGDDSSSIDLAQLIRWDPEKIAVLKQIQKKKNELKSAATLQRLISASLIKLNKLRHERLLQSTNQQISLPSSSETQLYQKVVQYIKIGILKYGIAPQQFSFAVDDKVPVLVSEYSGVLPGLPGKTIPAASASSIQQRPTNRLPSIRGPYKKKPRY